MKKLIKGFGYGICFLVLIYLVKNVDVKAIGPNGTSIGLASINEFVHNLFGVHLFLYDITDYLGICTIAFGSIFALMGLVQLIKGMSFFKVDVELYVLGATYILIGLLYAFFEIVVINTRPILMPGCSEVEASFPSSHTVLISTVLLADAYMMDVYVKDTKKRNILKVVLRVIAVLAVLCRLICGVHWFTDILGGVLLISTILNFFKFALDKVHDGTIKKPFK